MQNPGFLKGNKQIFMRRPTPFVSRSVRFWLALLLCVSAFASARAAEFVVGVASPAGDTAALLGAQLRGGARAAAAAARGNTVSLDIADETCDAKSGAAAAQKFVDDEVPVVIGFLCTEAIEAALPILKAQGIPVITPGVRTVSLTDRRNRTGWLVYRLAPRADAEEKAVSDILVKRWRDELFAIVDDGTIHGRELAENFRAAAKAEGLKPVYVDTYRPQLDNQIGLVGRLRKAGATHVLVGGDRSDIAIIARDAAKLNYKLTIAGGEALRDEGGPVPLAAGVLMIGLPRWADIAPEKVLQALRDQGVQPEGYAIPGFAALQVAEQALEKSREDDKPVADILASGRFSTAIGPVRFDSKGDLERDLYRLFVYNGKKFVAE